MKTHEILFQTLSQADDYVNGEQLAKELGVSLQAEQGPQARGNVLRRAGHGRQRCGGFFGA